LCPTTTRPRIRQWDQIGPRAAAQAVRLAKNDAVPAARHPKRGLLRAKAVRPTPKVSATPEIAAEAMSEAALRAVAIPVRIATVGAVPATGDPAGTEVTALGNGAVEAVDGGAAGAGAGAVAPIGADVALLVLLARVATRKTNRPVRGNPTAAKVREREIVLAKVSDRGTSGKIAAAAVRASRAAKTLRASTPNRVPFPRVGGDAVGAASKEVADREAIDLRRAGLQRLKNIVRERSFRSPARSRGAVREVGTRARVAIPLRRRTMAN
jgi:hypothetical protein